MNEYMKLLVNAVQMKAADQYTIQELGIASLELMERAANACVQTMQSMHKILKTKLNPSMIQLTRFIMIQLKNMIFRMKRFLRYYRI